MEDIRVQTGSVENQLQASPTERAMRNWLGAYRSLNKDYLSVKATALKFQNVVVLATKQIQSYESIIRENKYLNDRFIKYNANAEEISSNENKNLNEELNYLKEKISETNITLKNHKLQLQRMRNKLLLQSSKTNHMSIRSDETKAMKKKLLEYNHRLKERAIESRELYRSRALMFAYKLMDMAQELVSTKARSKAFQDASAYLKRRNDIIQLRQRILTRQLALRSELNNGEYNIFKFAGYLKYFQVTLHYLLSCLWECVSSLAQCPKLDGPFNKCQYALVFL